MVASRFQEARRRFGSDVRSECNNKIVGRQRPLRGLDLPAFRVDRLDGRLEESNPPVFECREPQLAILRRSPPEHEIELREAEIEEIVSVDDSDLVVPIESPT